MLLFTWLKLTTRDAGAHAAASSAAVLSPTLLAFRISVPPWLRMPPALAEVWRGVGPPGFKSVNMVNLSYWLLLTLSRSANHRSSDEVMEPTT